MKESFFFAAALLLRRRSCAEPCGCRRTSSRPRPHHHQAALPGQLSSTIMGPVSRSERSPITTGPTTALPPERGRLSWPGPPPAPLRLTESRAASRHGQRADMRERVQALIETTRATAYRGASTDHLQPRADLFAAQRRRLAYKACPSRPFYMRCMARPMARSGYFRSPQFCYSGAAECFGPPFRCKPLKSGMRS